MLRAPIDSGPGETVEAVGVQAKNDHAARRSPVPDGAVLRDFDAWVDLWLRMVSTMMPLEFG
jgi:hypothetical protein